MVKINIDARLSYDAMEAYNRSSIGKYLESKTEVELREMFDNSLSDANLPGYIGTDLVIYLLFHGRQQEAIDCANQIATSIQSSGLPEASLLWYNFLRSVLPNAIVLDCWEFWTNFIEFDRSNSIQVCTLLALSGEICRNIKAYAFAIECFERVLAWAQYDESIGTESIRKLISECSEKMNLTEESARNLPAVEQEKGEEKVTSPDSFDWDAAIASEENPNWDPYMDDLDGTGRILRRWQMLAGGTVNDEPWLNAEDFSFFFQHFRPDGAGLDKVFADIERGNQMLPRILEIFRCTSTGYKTATTGDAYFIIHNPPKVSNGAAKSISLDYCQKIADMDRALNGVKSHLFVDSLPSVKIIRGQDPSLQTRSEIEAEIYDICHAYFAAQRKIGSLGLILSEALYQLAADYNLARYVMWPLVEGEDELEDPFRAYAELWKTGGVLRISDDNNATLYLLK